MLDLDYVKRRLNEIREALTYMKTLIDYGIEEFNRDFRSRLAMRHCIITIVEAAASIAIHILRGEFNEEPESYSEAFIRLSQHGVINTETAVKMVSLARLRNLIVHRYWLIDDIRIFREAEESGIDNIKKYVEEVEGHFED